MLMHRAEGWSVATDSDHYFAHMTVPPFSWPCLLLWDTEHRLEFPEVVGGVPSSMTYSERTCRALF